MSRPHPVLIVEVRIFTDPRDPTASSPVLYTERVALPVELPRHLVLTELAAVSQRVLSTHDSPDRKEHPWNP